MNPLTRLSSSIAASLWFGAFLVPAAAEPEAASAATGWSMAHVPLQTAWAVQVSPSNALPEYPRPQMVRAAWLNLNGVWDYARGPKDAGRPDRFPGRILVPFPPESALSGVRETVTERDRLWYRRTFEVPSAWRGQRVWLHFGAVDWEALVRVNGQVAGQHQGGYDAFSLDITDLLNWAGPNELLVSVWDPADAGVYPRGKQTRQAGGGIYYTATSGIWQTVWLEPVAPGGIVELKLIPDIDAGLLRVGVQTATTNDLIAEARLLTGGKEVSRVQGPSGRELSLPVPQARLWSPEDPFLYDLAVVLKNGDLVLDSVTSYFGMRKVALGKDEAGRTRICLNNKPYFMLGLLDQGFWPEGVYTAPTDAALRYDIEVSRRLGFNLCRKHVKVEPERWYYWADKLGLLVWQDMPNGDAPMQGNVDVPRTRESAGQFEAELRAMVSGRGNHPSVALWSIFNEGWGEYEVARLVKMVKQTDPTRLVVGASGWVDRPAGDVRSFHQYPGPGQPKPEEHRAAVIGEFGGIGLTIPEHSWAGKTWGHREVRTVGALGQRYTQLLGAVHWLRQNEGLSGAIYTQLTDVELEGNGLLTYDRAVLKLDPALITAANENTAGAASGVTPAAAEAPQPPGAPGH